MPINDITTGNLSQMRNIHNIYIYIYIVFVPLLKPNHRYRSLLRDNNIINDLKICIFVFLVINSNA